MEIDIKNKEKILSLKIADIGFSVRTFNCLSSENIIFIEDLVIWDEYKLKRIPGLGKKSLAEIRGVLFNLGLSLGHKSRDISFSEDSIYKLNLDARTLNCLEGENIRTIKELKITSDKELMAIPNFGKKSLYLLKTALDTSDLSINEETIRNNFFFTSLVSSIERSDLSISGIK